MEFTLLSVNVGQPAQYVGARGGATTSAIGKTSVGDGVRVAVVGFALDGDVQVNKKFHGGPDKVLCVYFAPHFSRWRDEFGLEMEPGAFGENLTLLAGDEADVCLGDTYEIVDPSGGIRGVVEVSQPRIPCANVRYRWGQGKLPTRMEETGATGFYLRAASGLTVGAGDVLRVLDRPNPKMSVARANRIAYVSATLSDVDELAAVPQLSGEWRRFSARIRAKIVESEAAGQTTLEL